MIQTSQVWDFRASFGDMKSTHLPGSSAFCPPLLELSAPCHHPRRLSAQLSAHPSPCRGPSSSCDKCLGVMGTGSVMGEPRLVLSPAGWSHARGPHVIYSPWGQPHPAEVWQEWGPLFGTLRMGPLLTLVDLGLACVSKGHVTLPPLLFLLCDSSGGSGPVALRHSLHPSSLHPSPWLLFLSGAFRGGDREVHTQADEQAEGHRGGASAEQNPVLSSPAHVGTEGSFAHQGWAFCASPGPVGLEHDLEDGES